MRILILNWRDPDHPLAGGAEISLFEQAKIWQKKGAEITWFASLFYGGKEKRTKNGIRIIRKGSHYTVSLFFLLEYIKGKFKKTDVVIDCFHFTPFFTPLFIRNKKVVGLINEIAGKVWFDNLVYPFAVIGFLVEPYIIRLYRKKHFITGSESTSNELVLNGIDKNKITVIHHGFNKLSDVKAKKESIPTLLFIGRLSPDKGVEDALKVVEKLLKSGLKVKLFLAGKFENKKFENKFKRLIVKLGLGKAVKIFGYVSENKKAELIKRSWILIHPSKKEGWGLNVIEANSFGTPAVGYDVAGLKDSILDNKTGILVNPDVDSLTNALTSLFKDKKKLNELGQAAKKWSNHFSWEKAGRESYNVISKL